MLTMQLPVIAPVIFLALWALVMLMHAAWTSDARGSQLLTLVGLGLAAVLMLASPHAQALLFVTPTGPLLAVSPLSTMGSLVTLLLAALCVPLVAPAFGRGGPHETPLKPEFFVLLVLLVVGLLVMLMSSDFLSLYMGLELASFASYVLVAYQRKAAAGSEAALKYFVLGSLATALMLFGVALLYAATGSMNFLTLHGLLANQLDNPLVLVALVLVLVGLLFKLSVVPFHMWTPDVYEGAPTPVTAILASLPKLAALVVLLRLLVLPLAGLVDYWQPLLAALALGSMALGAVMAILQTNLKRLLGWSTVMNLGFVLAGVVAASVQGFGASVFYLVVYSLTNIALFAGIVATGAVQVRDLRGLGKTHAGLAAALTLALFSLAGVPPLGGFMAKLGVLGPLVAEGYGWLAFGGVLCSVVAAFYSLSIIKTMWFEQASPDVGAPHTPRSPLLENETFSAQSELRPSIHAGLVTHAWVLAGGLLVLGVLPSVVQGALLAGVLGIY